MASTKLHRIGSAFLLVIAVVLLASVVVGIDTVSRFFLSAYVPESRLGAPKPVAAEATDAEIAVRTAIRDRIDVAVSETRTRQIVGDLSSLPSRVVGYPGNETAYRYVSSAFERIGLHDIAADTFRVAMPIDRGAALAVAGDTVSLFALWPNKVRTSALPEKGLAGPLVYGGKGEWRDLDGKPLDGSIVLMDFDSVDRYRNARMMGARAIVFFDNGLVSRGEAEWKMDEIPLNIPRFYVRREDALRLVEHAKNRPQARLEARMDWENVSTWNVWGWIPGSDAPLPARPDETPKRWKDRLIVLTTHYDAMSVVPGVAPGAEHAASMAALLQIAEVLRASEPGYTVLCLATSGHYAALSGITDFLTRHARTGRRFLEAIPPEHRILPDVLINLDLSSGSDQVAVFSEGYTEFFDKQQETAILKRTAPFGRRLEVYAQTQFGKEAPRRYMDGILPVGRSTGDLFPTFIAMDHEPAHRAGLTAFSFVTPNDLRIRVDTPADLPEYMRFDALTRQIETISALMMALTRDPEALDIPDAPMKDLGRNLTGRIVEWDRSKELFTPKTPLPGSLVTLRTDWGNYSGVRTLKTTIADSVGAFAFYNLPALNTFRVRAYRFDENGDIAYAPDLGEEGAKMFPVDIPATGEVIGCVQVLFRCRSLDLMETLDPASLFDLGALTVLNAHNAGLRKFGADFYDDFGGKSAVVYAPPGSVVKALASAGPASIKYLMTHTPDKMLTNPVPPEDIDETVRTAAQGQGYPVDAGIVTYPMYRTAQDLWVLDMIRHGVKNDRASLLHAQARQALLDARESLARLDYTGFVAGARKAWGLEVRAYPDIKATADDTVKAVIFYFILVLPFAFIIERLLFGFTDIRRQMTAFGGLFVLVFLILQRVHPAFKLSMTPYIVFLAFVIMALGAVVMFLLTSKFNGEMNRIKSQATGVHETDIGRLSATGVAINLGISNIRKRKMRSTLTAITLILLTFTVLSFTSYSTSLQFYKIVRPNTPSYQGALIRNPSWWSLDTLLPDYLTGALGNVAIIAPRAMWMADFTSSRVDYENRETGEKSFITALMGFSPNEPAITGIDTLLTPGSRWFAPGERDVCILPTEVAARIGLTPDRIGAVVHAMGVSYRVIGFIDTRAWDRMRDLDDERMTPITFQQEGTVNTGDFNTLFTMTPGEHLDAFNTLILPYDHLIEINGRLRSVALAPRPDTPEGEERFYGAINRLTSLSGGETFYREIEAFLSRLSIAVFVGKEDKVTIYSSIGVTSVSGLQRLIMPILIAALLVLNTMMGAVHERFREIGVYSAVGLAPSHVSALFFAEAFVFATIGVVVGYLLGQAATMTMTALGMMQGLSLNYSSMSAVFSSVIVMAVVMLSAAYPAKKAADMSVQDVSRRWTLPEPDGDLWQFEFPFTVSSAEAAGISAYLLHVFRAHAHGVGEGFVTDGARLYATNGDGNRVYTTKAATWLAPFDLGLSQTTRIVFRPMDEDPSMYRIDMTLERRSGDLSSWTVRNRAFLKILRKRFLVWRTMGQTLKESYAREGRKEIETVRGEPVEARTGEKEDKETERI